MAFPIGEIQRPNRLSQGGGFITVANLVAKIGGQHQFKSSLNVAIPTLTANTLYMIYAVLSAPNTPALVISTNVNSVGPAGYTSWDLIGAFYANGMTSVGFGSFVNIIGQPETDMMPYVPVLSWVSNVNTPSGNWKRIGDKHMQNAYFNIVGPMSATTLTVAPPTNLLWDTNKISTGAAYTGTNGVWGAVRAGVTVQSGVVGVVGNNSTNWLVNNVNAYVNNTNPNTWGNGDNFSCDFSSPIAGWSNTQLKDL